MRAAFLSRPEIPGNHFERSIKRKLGKNHVVSIFGEQKEAYEVAGEIFCFLRKEAEKEGLQTEEAVVTIPVRFDGQARRDLRKAAATAGINIRSFVHEPFAAIVAYGHYMGHNFNSMDGATFLVFDWGGGTLDITLARVEGNFITETATGALEDIAGDLFDDRIRKFAENVFLNEHTLRPEDLSMLRPGTRDRLSIECEGTKISLSEKDQEPVSVAKFIQLGEHIYDLKVQVGRSDFETLINGDVQSALAEVDRVLEEGNQKPSEVDYVLLIGGSSRIPVIRSEMQKRFGARLIEVENADTIIAEGASIIAYNNWTPFLARPLQIVLSDESSYTVFQKGTVLTPTTCQKNITMFCTDNRDGEARLIIAEKTRRGDPSSTKVKDILNIPVSRELSKPYNHERVYLKFDIDEDLILNVQAHSAIERQVRQSEIYDLCIGLRVA